MDCPVCRSAMIVLEIEEVEIDYCTDCAGIWLDAGELELLLEDFDEAAKVLGSFEQTESDEAPRKCPICLKKMEKVLVGQSDGKRELIDRCREGHGLWFDRGELQQILKMGQFDSEGRVQKLLGDLFDCQQTE